MTAFQPAACLAAVEQSPAAVAVHDKQAWLSLFAADAVVEDPVGSAPHRQGGAARRADALGRFYETFIAPNQIHFEVDRDIVCGDHVLRDLTIVIAMSQSVTVRVPVHLLYELVEQGGALKVSRLAAHWELGPMLRQQLDAGPGFLAVGMRSFLRMFRQLGPGGIIGFSRAMSSVGDKGKERLYDLASALANSDATAMAQLFEQPDITVAFPHAGQQLSLADCAAQGGNLRLAKVLAAGDTVSASIDYQTHDATHHGVVLCRLNKHSLKISGLSFYWE